MTPPTDRHITGSTLLKKADKSNSDKNWMLRKMKIKWQDNRLGKYKAGHRNFEEIVKRSLEKKGRAFRNREAKIVGSNNDIIREVERELAAIQTNDRSTSFLRTTTEESTKKIRIPEMIKGAKSDDGALAVLAGEVPIIGSEIRRKGVQKWGPGAAMHYIASRSLAEAQTNFANLRTAQRKITQMSAERLKDLPSCQKFEELTNLIHTTMRQLPKKAKKVNRAQSKLSKVFNQNMAANEVFFKLYGYLLGKFLSYLSFSLFLLV